MRAQDAEPQERAHRVPRRRRHVRRVGHAAHGARPGVQACHLYARIPKPGVYLVERAGSNPGDRAGQLCLAQAA